MSKLFYIGLSLIGLLVGLAVIYWITNLNMKTENRDQIIKNPIPEDAEVATLAGGCFWCIEAAYEGGMLGIYEAISGYTGGAESDASYRLIAEKDTGHFEAVEVYYDPEAVSYAEILDVFWRQIDPTDSGGQFADRGPQYKTAIFYHNEVQKEIAEASKQALVDSGKFDAPIVTEILPVKPFYKAEENHQDFARKKSGYYKIYKKGSGRTGYIEEVWAK